MTRINDDANLLCCQESWSTPNTVITLSRIIELKIEFHTSKELTMKINNILNYIIPLLIHARPQVQ